MMNVFNKFFLFSGLKPNKYTYNISGKEALRNE